ncbi:hypothetical protein GCM10009830_09690 [Glycomyces endophyticus]|uniref:Uncharacterized protein n=1 Tax=Glycomyces endophyticus TaxID=480996 RepID=A0ABP4S966_9ACTN
MANRSPGGPGSAPALPDRRRPRELSLVRSLLWCAMTLCLLGAAGSIYSLAFEVTTTGVIAAVATTYFAAQSMAAPVPLERGSRAGWAWAVGSSLLGLVSGIPVISTGLRWMESNAVVLTTGLVWTVLYAVLLAALCTPGMRRWVFA